MMVNIMNKDLEIIGILDHYESLVWTNRFFENGDFELVTRNLKDIHILSPGNLLKIDDNDLMVIENLEVTSDKEDGVIVTVSGIPAYEHILSKRIIWEPKTFHGGVSKVIGDIIRENLISPITISRKIENVKISNDINSVFTDFSINAFYYGENLYEAVKELTSSYNIGIFSYIEDDNILIGLYRGRDLTVNQNINTPLIFSPKYDNLENIRKYISNSKIPNNILVVGEDNDKNKYPVSVGGFESGWDRNEVSLQVSNIKYNTISELDSILKLKGTQELKKLNNGFKFDARSPKSATHAFNKHYKLGDRVTVSDGLGFEGSAIISEIIRTFNSSGYKEYPGFDYGK